MGCLFLCRFDFIDCRNKPTQTAPLPWSLIFRTKIGTYLFQRNDDKHCDTSSQDGIKSSEILGKD